MKEPPSAIALLGGTFDPLHNGHIAIAEKAIATLPIEKVLFVPAKIPPHKQNSVLLPADIRLNLLESVLDKYTQFDIWRGEYRREKPSYTLDSIRAIREEFPQTRILFIIGSDNLTDIKTWHRYKELINEVEFAVTLRPTYSAETPYELQDAKLIWFESPNLNISSTEIRLRASEGKKYKDLVPKEIYEYLKATDSYSEK